MVRYNSVEKKILNDLKLIENININWYQNSRKLIELLSDKYKIDKDIIAGIIAITSPRNTVKHNLKLTLTVLENLTLSQGKDRLSFIDNLPTLTTIKKNLKRFLIKGYFNGIKINAFYNNLINDTIDVTVDIWIYRYFEKRLGIIGNWGKIVNTIIRLSEKLNMKPYELQERLWIISKRLYGKNKIAKYYLDYLKTYELYFKHVQVSLDKFI